MQFSIKSLVLLTSLIAISLSVYSAFGPVNAEQAIFVGIPLGLIFAGVFAHRNEKPIPFWKCFVAYALFFVWGTSWHTGPPSNGGIFFMAVTCAAGIVLSYSSIRHGHWATKIMGLLVFLPVAWFFVTQVYYTLRTDVVRYWSPT